MELMNSQMKDVWGSMAAICINKDGEWQLIGSNRCQC